MHDVDEAARQDDAMVIHEHGIAPRVESPQMLTFVRTFRRKAFDGVEDVPVARSFNDSGR